MDPDRTRRRLRTAALGIGFVRLGAGVALGAAPDRFLRWESVGAGSAMGLTLRTVGIRDLAIGLGTLHAASSAPHADVRRWVRAGLVSDALDVVAGLASVRTTGLRGVVSAVVALPMVAADLWALTSASADGPVAAPGPDRSRR